MVAEILHAIKACKTTAELNQISDFVKETKVEPTSVHEAIKQSKALGFEPGKKVMMKGDIDKEVGKVVKFNISTVGFYTGDRYPIIVKFERGTFEYGPDSLMLVEI